MKRQALIQPLPFEAAATGRRALLFVWMTGLTCILVVLLYILFAGKYFPGTIDKQYNLSNTSAPQPVDELLLTSDDAFFSSNKAFMNTALVYRGNNEKGSVEHNATDRTSLYKNLLNQKLSRVKRQHNGDFSVGPVPR